jgi:hypothetical protein
MFIANSFAQNLSYKIIADSIFSIIDTNYWSAKNKWLELEKEYPIDNRSRLLFINTSYQNNDTTYFQNQLQYLVKNNGFTLTDEYYWLSFYESITKGALEEWYNELYRNYHKEWVESNIAKLEIINKIEATYARDQLIAPLFKYTNDTCGIAQKLNASLIKANIANLNAVVDICKKNGEMPNAFDYPLSLIGKIEIIIAHNLQDSDSTDFDMKWNLILPYIEKAYFDGKISFSFFQIYDMILYQKFGYQYYGGLIKDAPFKDKENYEQRRKKYKL